MLLAQTRQRAGSSLADAAERPPCGCALTVIARWRENLDWTWKLRMPFVVMDKAAGNVGRESLSFLHFIVENYASRLTEMAENSSACVCFTQGILSGSQFGHVPNYNDSGLAFNRARLEAGANIGAIHAHQRWLEHDLCGTGPNEGEWACLPGILKALGIVPRPGPQRYATFVGSTMIVRASAITRVPLHAYWRLLHAHLDPTEVGCAWPDGEPWTTDRKSPASRVGYAMELTWRAIWSCERCRYKPLRRRGLFTCDKHPGRGWSPQRSYATGSRYYSEEWYAAHATMSHGSTR